MTNTKGKRRGARRVFFSPFRKHGVVPLATYMRIYKEGAIVDIKGMGAVQNGTPHKCCHGKPGRVYDVTQHAGSIIVNKQAKGKILARESTCTVSTSGTLRAGQLPEHGQESSQKTKEAKEKGTWVHLKCQPVPPRAADFVRAEGKEPELLEPTPYEFMAQCTQIKDLDCKNK
ncbi:60S ribosomal protein L21-like [Acomys russatus]|uniref:60S ribosomal protein L21-like n=1 Tax=Acomys russatus TaxID=60746 RepID=UPI0021E3425E|nr:60S ribosomal protein L21-like [Acomys russatus]